mmetsp:Transcript_12923/g.25245  ORF Transcript_12923/g.25245 Transcript_12923/m.25245 type:complete len:327 (-) Transcript_12923:455-1435(-)
MEALVQMGALPSPAHLEKPVSEKGDTPLLNAARAGNVQHLGLLMEANADIEAKNNGGATALFLATQSGSPQCVAMLLKANASVETWTNTMSTPLFIAAQKGHADCLQLLIEAKASVSAPAQVGALTRAPSGSLSPPAFSRQSSNTSTDSNDGGMMPDGRYVMPSKSGVTPCFIAAQQGHLSCLKILIAARANVDQPTNGGVTPVCIAAAEGYDECLQALIDAGANVNTVTAGGVTPVYIAAQKGKASCLRVLANASANCNTPTNDGSSAMFIAAHEGHLDCVRELLVGGALPEVKVKGKTPKQIAKANGHFAVAEMISDAVKARKR